MRVDELHETIVADPTARPAATGGEGASVDVLLADGSTAIVRPAVPADADALVSFHRSLSARSTSLRYFGVHPELSDRDVARMTTGAPDHVALVALRAGAIVAVAECHRAPGAEEAEVAFVVDDAYQGRGIATVLLEHLASAARRSGVRRLVADTLAENHRMLEVFRAVGFARTSRLEAGEVRVVLDVAPTAESISSAQQRDHVAVVRSMRRLLRPRSIAVIGASRRPGSVGHELLRNLVRGSFAGPVYAVNPSATSVAAVPCWPTVRSIPGDVDLAVVVVPAESVLSVVADCGEKGVGGLVVISSGFAEESGVAAVRQRDIVAEAHRWGMRLIGPNCFGVVNTDPEVSLNATFAQDVPARGPVGFASQSGGLGIAILNEASARGLGLSSFVSMGNKADVSGNDLLAYWEDDPATTVILLYLESLGNPRKFARLARRVGRTKPIVAVKSGRSAAGTLAAASHTAAMASSDDAVEALFAQCGVVRVDTVEELFDVAQVLAHQPVPEGHRVGVVTNAGGPGILAVDACVRSGLVAPELSGPVQASLRELLPRAASVRNPVDLGAGADADAFGAAERTLLQCGEVDCVVVVFTPPVTASGEAVARGIAEGATGAQRPVVAAFLGGKGGAELLAAATPPVPCFTYPENAVRAIGHAADYGSWRATRDPSRDAVPRVDPAAARRALVERDEAGWVTGAAALALLDAYSIPTARTVEVVTVAEAEEAAHDVPGPWVLKALGPSLVHKTEHGAVRLGLDTPRAVVEAYGDLERALRGEMHGAVVQQMASPGVEMLLGALQDPQMGAAVLVGLGGTTAELLGDHRLALAPLSASEARAALLSLRGAALLTGFRGTAPVDLDALVDAVVRLSHLVDDLPELAEGDCNPLIVSASGVVAVDARFRVVPRPPRDDRRRL